MTIVEFSRLYSRVSIFKNKNYLGSVYAKFELVKKQYIRHLKDKKEINGGKTGKTAEIAAYRVFIIRCSEIVDVTQLRGCSLSRLHFTHATQQMNYMHM